MNITSRDMAKSIREAIFHHRSKRALKYYRIFNYSPPNYDAWNEVYRPLYDKAIKITEALKVQHAEYGFPFTRDDHYWDQL